MLRRRDFLGTAAAGAALATLPSIGRAAPARPPRVLLRSSWQVVNIGDIAHTPGVLALLEKYVPEAEVTLWSSGDLTESVAELLTTRFPRLTIVKGYLGAKTGKPTTPELAAALDRTDFLLHGSGASFVAQKDVAAFVKATGKPFGIYGITYGGGDEATQSLMSRAKFVFFRETVSLAKAKSEGIDSPVMEFGPDGAFACDVTNDPAAEAYLASAGLERGKFVCCIPRLRYTPYWLIKEGRPLDEAKDARNTEMAEHDHAILRDAIAAVARRTDHKVLLCPEDMTQMQVGRTWVYDRLPADVKSRVVWRKDYWRTDEALSVYRRSSGLFGLEMHSPIMCIGSDVPALVGRFEEQTTKGFMWRDIGLDDWLFDFDRPEQTAKLPDTIVGIIEDPAAAKERAVAAHAVVTDRQAKTMAVVKSAVEAAAG